MKIIWLSCNLPAVALLPEIILDTACCQTRVPSASATMCCCCLCRHVRDQVAGAWACSLLPAAASAQTPLHVLGMLTDVRVHQYLHKSPAMCDCCLCRHARNCAQSGYGDEASALCTDEGRPDRGECPLHSIAACTCAACTCASCTTCWIWLCQYRQCGRYFKAQLPGPGLFIVACSHSSPALSYSRAASEMSAPLWTPSCDCSTAPCLESMPAARSLHEGTELPLLGPCQNCWPRTPQPALPVSTLLSSACSTKQCLLLRLQILTVRQLAQAVVRSWPCSPDPMAMLELMAEQEGIQGPPAEPVQDSVAIEHGIRLTRYAEELDAARDMGRHVPFLQSEAMQQG